MNAHCPHRLCCQPAESPWLQPSRSITRRWPQQTWAGSVVIGLQRNPHHCVVPRNQGQSVQEPRSECAGTKVRVCSAAASFSPARACAPLSLTSLFLRFNSECAVQRHSSAPPGHTHRCLPPPALFRSRDKIRACSEADSFGPATASVPLSPTLLVPRFHHRVCSEAALFRPTRARAPLVPGVLLRPISKIRVCSASSQSCTMHTAPPFEPAPVVRA